MEKASAKTKKKGYDLDSLFNPKAVAVIGASRKEGSIGYMVVKGLKEGGFEGKIYPINPSADEILGVKCYPSILDVPGEVSFAVIAVPQKLVSDVVEQCGKKGMGGVTVISSGFAEVGNIEAEKQLREICDRYNMWLVGPNIIGTLSNPAKCNASFSPHLPYPGKIAFVSQSGALLIGLIGQTVLKKIGMSHVISHGNMAGLDFADFVEALDKDENTNVICLYIEGFKDGRKFLDKARKCSKPIVALKAGVSKRGEVATRSHTGSLAGSPKVYKSLFRQVGVLQAFTVPGMFHRAEALANLNPMKGDNLLIITNGGGIGVLGTDAAEYYGVPLQEPPKDLQEAMRKWMPEFGSPRNPVDITGMGDRENYSGALRDALLHPWTHGVVVLYCETAQTDPLDIAQGIHQVIHETKTDKPVVVAYVGGERSEAAGEWLIKNGIPFYDDPEFTMSAMGTLRERSRYLERAKTNGEFEPWEVDRDGVREIFNQVRSESRLALTEYEAGMVFKCYGLPYIKSVIVNNEHEAVGAARAMGFPLALKILSPDILHKTEAKGVVLNISSEDGVRVAFDAIMHNARTYKTDANIHGVLIQKMARPGATEVIMGASKDPQFGPVVMFGLGGIFVEVLKDITFRAAPISPAEALEMIKEIKSYEIIKGYRGKKPKDAEYLAETISRLSQLLKDFPEIREIDANPAMIYEDDLEIVDALITLEG